MIDPKLTISYRTGYRTGYVILSANQDKKTIFTDEIKITSAKAREDYIKRLSAGRDGINKGDIADQLERIAEKVSAGESKRNRALISPEIEYQFTKSGMVYLKPTKHGATPVKLTNFNARIVSDVLRDDGIEKTHSLEIEARLEGRIFRFSVPASKFPAMNWCIENMGSKAIVFAGYSQKDHARAAIQQLSDDIKTREILAHTGWREIKGCGRCYLHADGAIGPEGPVKEIEVDLPAQLSGFKLPNPPDGEELQRTVHAAMDLLELGPEHITYPLFAAIWRSVLGKTDFSLHLAGATGVFKTEVAAIFQSFFGEGLDARCLPGSWSSTENSIEELCFVAKDTMVVVDDFAPTGTSYDIQRYHKKADRVFRAQGNTSGRGRMRSDGTLKLSRPPRGMILSTGEDIPAGQSLRARLLSLELSQDDIDKDKLTRCQKASQNKIYAKTMAGFLKWSAGRYQELRDRIKSRIPELRHEASKIGQHRRTPAIVAELQTGFEIFLDYTVKIGAIAHSESEILRARSWTALGEAAAAQGRHQEASEPATVFFQLLRSAIASGEAHVAGQDGEAPVDEGPEALGWRKHLIGTGDFQEENWKGMGARVGWIDGEDLYLDPGAAHKAVQRMTTDTDKITVTKKTLIKRLREGGHLLSRDEGRGKNTVRKELQGTRRNVLHIRAHTLVFRAHRAQQALDSLTHDEEADYDHASGARNQEPAIFEAQKTEAITHCSETGNEIGGPEGPKGPVPASYTPKKSTVIQSPPAAGDDAREEEEWTG